MIVEVVVIVEIKVYIISTSTELNGNGNFAMTYIIMEKRREQTSFPDAQERTEDLDRGRNVGCEPATTENYFNTIFHVFVTQNQAISYNESRIYSIKEDPK